jgi:hypothetical protein
MSLIDKLWVLSHLVLISVLTNYTNLSPPTLTTNSPTPSSQELQRNGKNGQKKHTTVGIR